MLCLSVVIPVVIDGGVTPHDGSIIGKLQRPGVIPIIQTLVNSLIVLYLVRVFSGSWFMIPQLLRGSHADAGITGFLLAVVVATDTVDAVVVVVQAVVVVAYVFADLGNFLLCLQFYVPIITTIRAIIVVIVAG